MKKFIVAQIFVFTVYVSFAQTSIENLFVNSAANVSILNFSGGGIPTVINTGITSGGPQTEGIAHVELNGRILFYVNASGVFDSTNVQMPGSVGINTNASVTEIAVGPVPGSLTQYYIFYRDNVGFGGNLDYAIVDMSLGARGDVIAINQLVGSGTFGEGLEVVRVPCQDQYWLLTYESNVGIKRFTVDATGIGSGQTIVSHTNPMNHTGQGELDYHNGKIGVALTNQFTPNGEALIADFNPVTGVASNAKTIIFPNRNAIYGLEFSLDASKVYFTKWYTNTGKNLFQYDIATGTMDSFLLFSTYSNGFGQIEMGPDSNLYIPRFGNGARKIFVLRNVNSTNFTIDSIAVNFSIGFGMSDHIQSNIVDYSFVDTLPVELQCDDGSTSTDISVPAGFTNVTWYRDSVGGVVEGSTGTITVMPTTTTTYYATGLVAGICDELTYAVTVTVTNAACPTPTFPCDDKLYFFRNTKKLAYVSGYESGSPTVTNLCNLPTVNQNCLGANPKDKYLYFIEWINGIGSNVWQVKNDCSFTQMCTLPSIVDPKGGCFDSSGIYWVTGFNVGLTKLQLFGISGVETGACAITKGPFDLPFNPPVIGKYTDLVYNIEDGLLYVITQMSKFYKIDLNGNVIDEISSQIYFTPPGIYGGLTIGHDGLFYGMYSTPGGLSAIDMDSLTASVTMATISPTPIGGKDDLASWAQYCKVDNGTTTVQTFVECEGFSIKVDTNIYNTTGLYTDIIGLDTIITDLTIIPDPIISYTTVDDNCEDSVGSISIDTTSTMYSYVWDNGDTTSSITNLSAGIYTVITTDTSGCIDTQAITISDLYLDCNYSIFIPNAFSPNGDGFSDYFLPRTLGTIDNFNMKIYNRWGVKVFETEGGTLSGPDSYRVEGWDGTQHGKKSPEGVYVYYIDVSFVSNTEPFVAKGNVTLVR